jgi:gas vesicle protein
MARMNKTQVAGLFFTGAAVGAAVALLYAPKTGVQTRKDIRRFSRKAADRFEDFQDDVRSQVVDGYEQVIDAFDKVRDFVEDSKNRVQKLIRTA